MATSVLLLLCRAASLTQCDVYTYGTNRLVRQLAPFLFDGRGELIAAGNEDMDTHVPWQKVSKQLGAYQLGVHSKEPKYHISLDRRLPLNLLF